MAGKKGVPGKIGYARLKRRENRVRVRFLGGLFLAIALVGLQYRLWVGDGSYWEVSSLRGAIEAQQDENERLYARNLRLEAEVRDLRTGLESIEHRARRDLGMTRRDETFYQIVERR